MTSKAESNIPQEDVFSGMAPFFFSITHNIGLVSNVIKERAKKKEKSTFYF